MEQIQLHEALRKPERHRLIDCIDQANVVKQFQELKQIQGISFQLVFNRIRVSGIVPEGI